MWKHDCGFLPVCPDACAGPVVGVITDRDICMSAMFDGKPLHDLRVETAMAHVVESCRPDDTVIDAMLRMRRARVRRLPVLDRDGTLVGVLALADLAREAARQQNAPRHKLCGSDVCSTLADICTPAADCVA
jgi:CBS domain-containing protein